jgi:hypothetical protein
MRFSQLTGLTMVAAMTFLAGCSGSGNVGSGITPSGAGAQSHASSQALGGARPYLKITNATPFKGSGCGSQYTGGCYQIDASDPAVFEWCVSSSGNCSSGLIGDVSWTVDVTNPKGKSVKLGKKIDAVWSPNPGNPSDMTISTHSTKDNPKVKYAVSLSGCYTSGCFTDFVVYGIAI